MKTSTKILLGAIALILVFGLVFALVKLISGTFSLIGSAFNGVLGILVLLALVVLVIWMFSFARKAQDEKKQKDAAETEAPQKTATDSAKTQIDAPVTESQQPTNQKSESSASAVQPEADLPASAAQDTAVSDSQTR